MTTRSETSTVHQTHRVDGHERLPLPGRPASREGLAFGADLHWQALAHEWACILFSPSYHVTNDNTGDVPGCSQLWFDPRLFHFWTLAN